MKNKIIAATLAAALTIPVLATTPAFAATWGENAQQRLEMAKTNAQERQEMRQENRQERRDNIAARHADRLENRFNHYYQRLSDLISKVEARLIEASNSGKDMSAATTKLSEAKSTLSAAKSYADQAIAKFRAIEPAKYDAQRSQALAARDLANQAREQFKKTVSLVRESVRLAKAAK